MLINELKNQIKDYSKEDLTEIIVELYKKVPKKTKEDYNFDEMIQNIQTTKSTAVKKEINFTDLIDAAKNKYYFVPNKVIPKTQRPKWRFKVKNYIKELTKIPVDSERGAIATNALANLYDLVSYACGHRIFNSEDPF